MRFVPAAIDASPVTLLDNGSLYSKRFDDVYASSAGAVEQAQQVFLAGNGLPQRWLGAPGFTIVETGFGAAINFLTTWEAWRTTAASDTRLHFVSLEKHPFTREALREIHGRWPRFAALSGELLAAYPPLLPGFHRLQLDSERVTLTLLFGDAAQLLPELDARADAFFLDGFSPAKNPEMWSDVVFAQLARLAKSGATAASYTVAGRVRAGLEAVGFAVAKESGCAPKREKLVARFRSKEPAGNYSARGVIVIGAGLAGTACAQRLSARGRNITLFDRNESAGRGASGNPTAILRPHVGIDWIAQVQLSLDAFLYGAAHIHRLAAHDAGARLRGVVHVATDSARMEKIRATLARLGMPEEVMRPVSAQDAARLCGVPVAAAGWFYPGGGWVEPVRLCEAQLAQAGDMVEHRFNQLVASLRRVADRWQVLDAHGDVLGEAAAIIVANAHDALGFEQFAGVPIRPVRGQLSYLPEHLPLRLPLCGDGYVTPAINGVHCVGASFNEGMNDDALRVEDHAENLRRLRRIAPGFGGATEAAVLGGRVSFRSMSVDLMPIAGELQTGLFACVALGSRGIALAPMLAEFIASKLTGEPAPLADALAHAIDPNRFARARL